MTRHRFDLLDVFAERPLEGNPLAVVHDADGVSHQVMLRLARRLRLSETSFVQVADDGADYRNRIWTVEREIPFAGHPSIGTAVAVALARGMTTGRLIQRTLAGDQPLEVEIDHAEGRGRAAMEVQPVDVGPAVDPVAFVGACSLHPGDVAAEPEARLVSVGLPTLIVPLRSLDALGRIRVDWPAFERGLATHAAPRDLNVYFVVETEPGSWRARCLAADLPGGEDPATGSAAAAFGGYLATVRGPGIVRVLQGVEMGDPSHIEVDTRTGIVLGGQAIVRATGTIDL